MQPKQWSQFISKVKNSTSQVYAPTTDAKEVEVDRLYEDLQQLLELTPKKKCPFHHRRLECKTRKLRDTWSNSQIWPWSTKWNRSKANRDLPREHTGHSKHPLPTTQDSTYRHHQMVNTEMRLIIFFVTKDGEVLYSPQKQDWELIVAQLMNSLLPNSDLNWRK